tara:strand:+ start:36 stop:167 length:132 start_codon:yes stop_codon:yes gene_type:complete
VVVYQHLIQSLLLVVLVVVMDEKVEQEIEPLEQVQQIRVWQVV